MTPLIKMIPVVRVIDYGALGRASLIKKITPLLTGLYVRNRCQFGGIRTTGLDKGRVCQYRHSSITA